MHVELFWSVLFYSTLLKLMLVLGTKSMLLDCDPEILKHSICGQSIYEGKPSTRRRDPIGREGKFAPFYEIFG